MARSMQAAAMLGHLCQVETITMELWLLRNNQRYGPYSLDDVTRWHQERRFLPGDLLWHSGRTEWCSAETFFGVAAAEGTPARQPPFARQPSVDPRYVVALNGDDDAVRRIADYERLSGIFWMCLGVIQVLSVVGIVAGIWNIFAATSRFALVPRIRRRDPEVPELYEGMGGIVIIAIVNLLLGGVIGLAFAAFDFYIRDQVLRNRVLFDASATDVATEI